MELWSFEQMGSVWRLAFLGTGFFWLLMVLVVTLLPAHSGEAGNHAATVSPKGDIPMGVSSSP